MPELPEVETIRQGLQTRIVGATFASVEVLWAKSLSPDEALNKIVGQTVSAIHRRAKVLIIELKNGFSLLIHLKMTGQMVLLAGTGQRFAGGHPTPSMAAELPDNSTRV